MKYSYYILIVLSVLLFGCRQNSDYTQYVDTRIGTGGHGHVFVGANVPFGLVQLGPTSIPQDWDWCSGYHDSDSTVIGFSHMHLSGTGIGDLFDVTVMPVIGQVTYVEGSCIGLATFEGLDAQQKLAFDRAYLCINTIEVAEKDYVLNGNLISQSRYNDLIEIAKTDDEYLAGIDITQYFSLAWTCKKAGKYGGTYFNANQNYNAIDICALPNAERTKKVKIEGKDVKMEFLNTYTKKE